jgi:dimeric dUTPase (all-alpha-NTP-PPase superfamily)
MLKFIQKWLHNKKKFFLNMVLVDYIGIFFDISEYFWQMTVFVYITLFSKLINVTKVKEWECSNQYKENTYH